LLALAGLCACFFAFIFLKSVRIPTRPGQISGPPSAPIPQLRENFKPANYERVVYPYSVIPGGVRSREELAASISRDPVVAAHYADFKVSRARMIQEDQTRFMHVSYRMQDQIYWTAKKIKIPQGETLITDGDVTARARCGNQVSAVPLLPVSDEEPMLETFDLPRMAAAEEPELGPVAQVNLELREFSPFEYIPIEPNILPYYYRPLFVVNPPNEIPVPEGSTFSLLVVGLAACFVSRFARQK
jgi:hypothetical protein